MFFLSLSLYKGRPKVFARLASFPYYFIMIEFKRNGDNTIASNRIPVFVGEFVYDEEKESFIRNGRGYWIDQETRIATQECEWKDGVEVSGRDLVDGWYTRFFTISSFLFYTNGMFLMGITSYYFTPSTIHFENDNHALYYQ